MVPGDRESRTARGPDGRVPSGPVDETIAGALVLIIDDEVAIRRLVRTTLHKEGYRTAEADNGRTGIDLVMRLRPDLVILDVQMDELDGLETLKLLRETESTRDLPVIMVTALDDALTTITCLREGANDFVGKPFHREELLARVRAHLQARSSIRLRALLEFAGAACHEMNQPLQVILGHCELLDQSGLPGPQTRHIHAIEAAAERLAGIVGQIRQLDRYETKSYLGEARILDLSAVGSGKGSPTSTGNDP